MAQFHPAWLEHQRKRWRRHDWQRYVRPDRLAYQRLQYAHLEQEPDARKQGVIQEGMTMEELEAYRSELLELKALAAELKWQLALRRFARKYSPDRPRVPAGNPDGGQWTSEGGGTSLLVYSKWGRVQRHLYLQERFEAAARTGSQHARHSASG